MNRLLKYLMLIFAAVSMAACSDSISGGDDAASGISTLYMRVSPADLAGSGVDVTNVPDIDKVHSLRIVLVDATGRVEHNHHIDFTDPALEHYYRFEVTTGKKQIFLIANEESVTGDIQHEGTTKTFSQVLDYYVYGMPGFVDAINSVYFTPQEGKPVPMSSKYDIEVEKGENEASFYLVRSLVKFTFNFINKRTDDVQINSIAINKIADEGFLMAHVGPTDTYKDFIDKDNNTETLHWIDWLHKVADESNTLPFNPDNTTLNDRVGWITDYTLPSDAYHTPYLIDFSDAPFTIGAATTETDENGVKKLVPTVVADNKHYYMPESKCIEGSEQQYTLTFNIEGKSGAFDITKPLPNLRALFRNTFVIVDVTMTQVDIEVDVLPYTGVILRPDFGLELPSLRLEKKNAKGEWVSADHLDLYNDKASFNEVRAINKNGTNITDLVDWEIENSTGDIMKIEYIDDQGNTTEDKTKATSVKVWAKGTVKGRAYLTASYDLEVGKAKAEAMVVVADRHIFFPKTYIGMYPDSTDEFEAEVVAEKDDSKKLYFVLTDQIDDPDVSGISNLANLTQAEFEAEINKKVSQKSDIVSINEVDGKFHVTSTDKEGVAYLHGFYLCKKSDGSYEILHGVCEVNVSAPMVYIRRTKAVIDLGSSTSLVVQIRPVIFNKKQKVKFRSEDPSIATVDEHGVVTGVKSGSTRVICYNDEDFDPVLENSIEIEVRDNRLLLDKTSLQLLTNEKQEKLTATFYEDGEAKDVTLAWKSSDTSIATCAVNSDGSCTINPLKAGTTQITVTYGAYTASCIVVVAADRIVEFINCPPYLFVGDVLACDATVFPNKDPDAPLTFTWSSSDPEIADFDPGTNVLRVKKKYGDKAKDTITITAHNNEYNKSANWSLLVK